MYETRNFLRLNVGFIAHQTIGYSRDFPLEIPALQLSPDLRLKDVTGRARVTRTHQGLLLQVKMSARTSSECVRCLEPFEQPLEIDFTDLYAFSPNSVSESGLLLPENSIIDLGPVVREEMLLAMPINPICRPDCKGLCLHCGENQNLVTCNHLDEDIDPRLDALRALLDEGASAQELSDHPET
jgi:uncharacterized protein